MLRTTRSFLLSILGRWHDSPQPFALNRRWPILGLIFLAFLWERGGNAQRVEFGTKPQIVHRSFFTEYSNNSSHIFLGVARERKFFSVGTSYTVRFLPTRYFDLAYRAEFRPLVLESDPTLTASCLDFHGKQEIKQCGYWKLPLPVVDPGPGVLSYIYRDASGNPIYTATVKNTYSRRWNYAGGMSPLGYDLKILPRHRVRPVFTGQAGFLISTRDFPVWKSSNFNFAFGGGLGFERDLAPGRTMRLEYRFQHISNDYIGAQNPGIDAGVVHLAYNFGR